MTTKTFLDILTPIWKPHQGQEEFLLNNSRLKVLACGRRWGKTDACAAQVVSTFHDLTPTKHFLVAPTMEQAKILFYRVLDLIYKLIDAALVPWEKPAVRLTPFP
jgi:hypothetical protein